MQLPKIKKRISGFLVNEEGTITKQSLVSMGAFLSGATLGSLLAPKEADAMACGGGGGGGGSGGGGGDGGGGPCPCGATTSSGDCVSHTNCPDNPNSNPAVEKGCDHGLSGCADPDPGEGLGWDKDGLVGHKAYNANGDPVIYGDGKCSNDDMPFHFNGVHFSYTGDVLASQHHHHASHNSY